MDKEGWLEIWKVVRQIEDIAKVISPTKGRGRYEILIEVNKVKKLIQQEVGKLE